MNKVLYDLYCLLDHGEVSPEYQKALEEVEPICQQMEKKLSMEEFDTFWSSAVGVGASENPVWFARGFRLGARVMMEVLKEH